jgi:CheY-like chemotaxis protein
MRNDIKILLVEDNKLSQKIISFWLSKYNYKFVLAETGEKAIEFFRKDWFDIIIMDLMLPGINGFETSRLIREAEDIVYQKHSFIIALTANTLDNDRARCLTYGMDEYMSKPIDVKALNEILEFFMSEKDKQNDRKF